MSRLEPLEIIAAKVNFMMALKPVIYVEDPNRYEEGKKLANQLKIDLATEFSPQQMVLTLTHSRLELRIAHEKMSPIYVDFLEPTLQHRLQKSNRGNELIAKAIGLKANFFPQVLDTTAGLANDAVIMANLGCEVIMLERSPIICALLEDGVQRAQLQRTSWLQHLKLICEDAICYLKKAINQQIYFDVVYLDPMFPERVKSALVKKEMRILKEIVGEDEDSEILFELAKKCAKKRVVVKRPRYAKTLTNEVPDVVYKGKATRFDVYFMGL